MRLLIVTQAVDERDLQLSFFTRWVEEIAQRVDSVIVICLKEGEHHLPSNVSVHSLGKEKRRQSPFTYAIRFKKLAWKLRKEYDAAFVHMNQEYILLAGPLWKLLGKEIYMWRNHYDGTWLTDVAAFFCGKVFCTSKFSYTAKYKKTVLMPVGVDMKRFFPDENVGRKKGSILFFARIAPSKRVEVLIGALKLIKDTGIDFTASIYGSPLPKDEGYYLSLKKKVEALKLADQATFYAGVPNPEAPDIFRAHEIFVNCAKSGMFDKTLFEAAACGDLVLASSEDFRDLAGAQHYFTDEAELAEHLMTMLTLTEDDRVRTQARMLALARAQDLSTLVYQLAEVIT